MNQDVSDRCWCCVGHTFRSPVNSVPRLSLNWSPHSKRNPKHTHTTELEKEINNGEDVKGTATGIKRLELVEGLFSIVG